jgi:hypothetical protein
LEPQFARTYLQSAKTFVQAGLRLITATSFAHLASEIECSNKLILIEDEQLLIGDGDTRQDVARLEVRVNVEFVLGL